MDHAQLYLNVLELTRIVMTGSYTGQFGRDARKSLSLQPMQPISTPKAWAQGESNWRRNGRENILRARCADPSRPLSVSVAAVQRNPSGRTNLNQTSLSVNGQLRTLRGPARVSA